MDFMEVSSHNQEEFHINTNTNNRKKRGLEPLFHIADNTHEKTVLWRSASTPHTPTQMPSEGFPPKRRHSDLILRTRHHSDDHKLPALPRFSCTGHGKPSLVNWSEYTVRKSLVKFRTRKSATYSRRRHHSPKPRTPSQTIKKVLDKEYELCRCDDVSFEQRVFAVAISWFYGWIIDLYYCLTDEGRERSFLRWLLACLLVTMATVSVLAVTTYIIFYVNCFLLVLMNSAMSFMCYLLTVVFCTLALLAVINFD